MSDPYYEEWEKLKCACASFDPDACVGVRLQGYHVGGDTYGDPCSCSCHDLYYEAEDQAQWESMAPKSNTSTEEKNR